MTNVVVAAYAVGDIDNLKDSFNSWLEVKKVYTPDPRIPNIIAVFIICRISWFVKI